MQYTSNDPPEFTEWDLLTLEKKSKASKYWKQCSVFVKDYLDKKLNRLSRNQLIWLWSIKADLKE